jgi:Domain of unknown function (DUF4440)
MFFGSCAANKSKKPIMTIKKLIVLSSICVIPCIAKSQELKTKDQNEVYKIIVLISKAWTQNNLDTLDKYLDRDYVHTDVRGQILNRVSWLNYVKDRKDKNVTNPDVEFDEVKVTVYKEFAFATGINTFIGPAYTSNDKNANKIQKIRFTQVLKREKNLWKRLMFQATYIDTP